MIIIDEGALPRKVTPQNVLQLVGEMAYWFCTIVDLDAAATDLALATGSNADEAYALLEQYNDLCWG